MIMAINIEKFSELIDFEQNLKFISSACDPVEIVKLDKGYGLHVFLGKHEIIAQGADLKAAAFDAVDQIRNQLLD
jgi:hypothetical protein